MKVFSEKLLELRRQKGLSQEQLADRLGVTRQSVSKWESGAALPELGKLIALSDLFSVSVDYLVKDQLEEPAQPIEPAVSTTKLEEQVEEISRYFRAWEWNSKTKVFGLPLVSVCFCVYPHMMRCRKKAKGIIAIGNIAVGVVALGALSVGIFSMGAFSLGAFALGALAFGLTAVGPVAIGLLAFGPVAIGLWYAGGVAALGGNIAVGVAAVGETAVGCDAAGQQVLLCGDGLTQTEVEAFLSAHHPRLWKPLLHLLSLFGANLK
ncbi:MAG: helix-turn-helix transcriptional regulator [Oscillibacter sp.]|nr:helix-turn-helix transcriptional regulator [Oscillibacter sp.]